MQTGWIGNPGCKLMMLPWNPGRGCRNLLDIIRRSVYNLVVLQEEASAEDSVRLAVGYNPLSSSPKALPTAGVFAGTGFLVFNIGPSCSLADILFRADRQSAGFPLAASARRAGHRLHR